MNISNPLILFNNHFTGHRRNYPYRTRLAIAADLGYEGYEFHPTEPGDDKNWDELGVAYGASGLKQAGMYVVAKGANDDEVARIEDEINRLRLIIDRLAALKTRAYLNFTISSNPAGRATPDYRDSGSSRAEQRHWERTARILKEVDAHLELRGVRGNLYNHVWFITDTPAAVLRTLRDSGAKIIKPGLASFHAFFHAGVPDIEDVMVQPGMENLGYFALLNGWPKPAEPFRTRPLDDGNVDIAGMLGLLWKRGYTGPIVSQGFDLGGDPYESARRAIQYVRDIQARFQRNPALNPFA